MPTRWETYPIPFAGGLITNLGRLEQGIQAPGSATVLQNFEPDVQGGYTRILGYEKFSPSSVPGAGQIFGVFAISPQEVLALRGGQYQYSTGAAWTAKATLPVGGVTKFSGVTYNFNGTPQTMLVDGINAPVKFDHATKNMTYLVTPPTEVVGADVVEQFKSHIFFGSNNFLSFTVPFTDNNFHTGSAGGVVNVGDTIVALKVFRDQLIVFCLNSIYRLSGNSVLDFVLSPITKNTGCLNGDTVQEIGGDLMYLGPDGIRYLSASERENDFGLTRASEKVQKGVLDFIKTSSSLCSVTISSKNQYRIFGFSLATPQRDSQGYLATKYSNQDVGNISWATLKGVKVYSINKVQGQSSEVIVFSSDTPFIYRMETGNSFDGENIESVFETPYLPISDPNVRKTFYKHVLYAKPVGGLNLQGTIKFDYQQARASQPFTFDVSSSGSSTVYGNPSSIYGTSVYNSRGEEQYYNNLIGSGFVAAFRYSNSSQEAAFNLNFLLLEYRTNERR